MLIIRLAFARRRQVSHGGLATGYGGQRKVLETELQSFKDGTSIAGRWEIGGYD